MKEEISEQSFLDSFSTNAIQAICLYCGELEWVIGMSTDSPIDDTFLSNYYCDDCDKITDENLKAND